MHCFSLSIIYHCIHVGLSETHERCPHLDALRNGAAGGVFLLPLLLALVLLGKEVVERRHSLCGVYTRALSRDLNF